MYKICYLSNIHIHRHIYMWMKIKWNFIKMYMIVGQ
jgi:hypothetical protein